MRTTLSLSLALCVLAAGCAGPREPLDVGLREVASDITIGATTGGPSRTAPSPVPPTAVVVDLPVPSGFDAPSRFDEPAGPPTAPTAAPTPGRPCPAADPLAAPAVAAPHDRARLPVEATYAYGNDGTYRVSGANADEGTFTDVTTRTVQAVQGDGSARFTYEVAAMLAGTTTTTTYEVRNTASVPDAAGAAAQAGLDDDRGLYLVSVRTEGPDGSTSTFRPGVPLLLLPFPAFAETEWDALGTDPISGTTMSFHGRVVGRADVDACGVWLDALRVELTDGRVVGPLTDVTFAATYDLATQFGGLSVHDIVELAGREGLDTLERRNEASIRQAPQGRRS